MAPILFHGLSQLGFPVVCVESRQAYQALKSLATHPAQDLTPPVTTRTIVVPEGLRHGRGQSSVPACRPLGGNIRVGLDDSLWMGPGELAKSNAEQVARARQIAGKAAIV
jgi:hypothetical protein